MVIIYLGQSTTRVSLQSKGVVILLSEHEISSVSVLLQNTKKIKQWDLHSWPRKPGVRGLCVSCFKDFVVFDEIIADVKLFVLNWTCVCTNLLGFFGFYIYIYTDGLHHVLSLSKLDLICIFYIIITFFPYIIAANFHCFR
jgi:hypothetical protein